MQRLGYFVADRHLQKHSISIINVQVEYIEKLKQTRRRYRLLVETINPHSQVGKGRTL